jgi:nucleotidyltransferase substrate binding protein (TIGR01987 family)
LNARLANLLDSLESALVRLDDALRQPPTEYNRDACIQRFEFCFELLWKSLKAHSEDAGLRTFSPKESLRNALQLGLLDDDAGWLWMIEDRNLTSHTYNEATAVAIYSRLPQHLPMMNEALRRLRAAAAAR